MKRIKSKYESEYVDADEYVIVNNNDTDLHPVIISLPEPPQIHLIEGYGLPARDQRDSIRQDEASRQSASGGSRPHYMAWSSWVIPNS